MKAVKVMSRDSALASDLVLAGTQTHNREKLADNRGSVIIPCMVVNIRFIALYVIII